MSLGIHWIVSGRGAHFLTKSRTLLNAWMKGRWQEREWRELSTTNTPVNQPQYIDQQHNELEKSTRLLDHNADRESTRRLGHSDRASRERVKARGGGAGSWSLVGARGTGTVPDRPQFRYQCGGRKAGRKAEAKVGDASFTNRVDVLESRREGGVTERLEARTVGK
jgi:hypothetical protein